MNESAVSSTTGAVVTDPNAKTWAMLCHLSSFVGFIGIPFGQIIGPLVLWLVKRKEHPFIDEQGKEALNFNISIVIYYVISLVLTFILIGFLFLLAIFICEIIFVIMAAMKTNKGETYRYPLTIRFIK